MFCRLIWPGRGLSTRIDKRWQAPGVTIFPVLLCLLLLASLFTTIMVGLNFKEMEIKYKKKRQTGGQDRIVTKKQHRAYSKDKTTRVLDGGHSIECKLTPTTRLPSICLCILWPCDLDLWHFDLILIGGRGGLVMDYPCGKFDNRSFNRFGFVVRTDRQTHRHRRR